MWSRQWLWSCLWISVAIWVRGGGRFVVVEVGFYYGFSMGSQVERKKERCTNRDRDMLGEERERGSEMNNVGCEK